MDEVIPGVLFIGDINAASNIDLLQEHRITHVVNATFKEVYYESIVSINFQLEDEEDQKISHLFEETRQHILLAKNQGTACLVHCMAGISRSSTLVLSYLILEEGMTLFDAWQLLLQCRKDIHPNDGFWIQLMELDKNIHGKYSIDDVEYRLRSLAIEFEDYITLDEIFSLFDELQDVEAVDSYLLDKYLTFPESTSLSICWIED